MDLLLQLVKDITRSLVAQARRVDERLSFPIFEYILTWVARAFLDNDL
jgi:hypothetical protein